MFHSWACFFFSLSSSGLPLPCEGGLFCFSFLVLFPCIQLMICHGYCVFLLKFSVNKCSPSKFVAFAFQVWKVRDYNQIIAIHPFQYQLKRFNYGGVGYLKRVGVSQIKLRFVLCNINGRIFY